MYPNPTHQKNNLVWFATIVNTHGIKGELRILSNSDYIEERFNSENIIYFFDNKNNLSELKTISFRFHKQFVLVFFENINSIEEGKQICNKKLYSLKEDVDEKSEIYLQDLIGFEVFDEKNKFCGKVISYFDQGPYYSLIIRDEDIKINIPVIDDFIKKNDYKNKRVLLNRAKGEI